MIQIGGHCGVELSDPFMLSFVFAFYDDFNLNLFLDRSGQPCNTWVKFACMGFQTWKKLLCVGMGSGCVCLGGGVSMCLCSVCIKCDTVTSQRVLSLLNTLFTAYPALSMPTCLCHMWHCLYNVVCSMFETVFTMILFLYIMLLTNLTLCRHNVAALYLRICFHNVPVMGLTLCVLNVSLLCLYNVSGCTVF